MQELELVETTPTPLELSKWEVLITSSFHDKLICRKQKNCPQFSLDMWGIHDIKYSGSGLSTWDALSFPL